jgi:hypothetical protein
LEFEHVKDKWATLTPAQRVLYCRRLAQESKSLSASATPKVKQTYLDLSAQWLELADEIERTLQP